MKLCLSSNNPGSSPAWVGLCAVSAAIITAEAIIRGPQALTAAIDSVRGILKSGESPEDDIDINQDDGLEEADTPSTTGKEWKRKNQVWRYEWVDTPSPEVPEDEIGLVFLAIDRTWGHLGETRDDHLWIEAKSHPLLELLRFEFKHVNSLLDDNPGIDARELYARRERLVELTACLGENPREDRHLDLEEKEKEESSDGHRRSSTGDDEQPRRGALSDELEANGPPLSKLEYAQALRDLKILCDFLVGEFEKVDAVLERFSANGTISWRMLWALFSTGQRVETTHVPSGEKMAFIMKEWSYTRNYQGIPVFQLQGRWLEWTGYRYVEQTITRDVPEYSGLKEASSLPVRHMSEENFQGLMARGRMYTKYAGVHHLNYNSYITLANGTKVRAEGRLMVDVASYRRIKPDEDKWSSDDLHSHSANQDGSTPATWRTTIDDQDVDLTLLPPTLHGWSFVAKVWGEILVDNLRPVPFQPHIFNHLVLRNDYKTMIRSLVDAHVNPGKNPMITDVVAGKGGGLVLVLHGKPGTGKTLTAEAVSEHLRRPLYMVSSGELGLNAADLETKLRDTLDVAAIWKAVLLIDEADVFLEARSNHELDRNALVSVFLRALEYHSGILILTTNRIRSFDDAFHSRFSLAIRYPELDEESRRVLLVKFLLLAGASVEGSVPTSSPAGNIHGTTTPHEFSLQNITELSLRKLNGRVIKHTVRTAQALAISAEEQLSMSHLETVLAISDQFAKDWKEMELGDTPETGSS